jgi:hypothetical protein
LPLGDVVQQLQRKPNEEFFMVLWINFIHDVVNQPLQEGRPSWYRQDR